MSKKTTPVYRTVVLTLKVDADTCSQEEFDHVVDKILGYGAGLLENRGLKSLAMEPAEFQAFQPDTQEEARQEKAQRQEMKKLQHRLLVNMTTAIEKAFEETHD